MVPYKGGGLAGSRPGHLPGSKEDLSLRKSVLASQSVGQVLGQRTFEYRTRCLCNDWNHGREKID